MEQPVHFKKVDFLRGIAILLVFLYHAQITVFHTDVTNYNTNGIIAVKTLKDLLLNFLPGAFGWSGVELFLIISGFLIHYGYLAKGGIFKPTSFFSKRFWRIYPPYLLVLFVCCITATNGPGYYFSNGAGVFDLVAHLLLLHNLHNSTFFGINPSFWSLALEAQLYLLYPLLLFIRKRIGINKTLLIILLLSFLTFGFELLMPSLHKNLAYYNSLPKLWFVWAAGACLGEKAFQKKTIFGSRSGVLSILLLAITIASRAFLFTSQFTLYFITLLFVALFEWLLLNETLNTSGRVFNFISLTGLCSYSIYLIHQPWLNNLFGLLGFNYYRHYLQLFPLRLTAAFLIIFSISWLLYRFIELPSIKFGQRLRKRQA